MRRFRDRQSNKLFRGGEMGRMLTMIGMLLVLVMIIRKARDADTWRFLANDPGLSPAPQVETPTDARPASAPAAGNAAAVGTADGAPRSENSAAADSAPVEATEAEATPPLDQDAEERDALAEEFQAITDRTALAKEDMFAYWRLLRWTESAKLSELLKRGRTDVRYGDLILDPAAYRGELLKIRLHVVQLLKFTTAADDNPLGIETYYQALGWNDSSQVWFYFCVFTDLPPGMPVGDRITQEGTFVGYFLKTIAYKDGLGKGSQAPVLIGRMVWHPNPPVRPHDSDGILPWVVGGLLLAGFGFRMIWRMWRGKKREPMVGLLRGRRSSEEPTETVEEWLDRPSLPRPARQ